MLVSFLFWNLMKRPLQNRVAGIVSTHEVDVVLLAECVVAPADIEAALKQSTGQDYYFSDPVSVDEKIHVFMRFKKFTFVHQFNDFTGSLTIRRFRLEGVPETLLAVVHFPSRVNYEETDQTLEATRLAADIANAEQDTGITRTILVGDLNMNPFHPGVSGAHTLNAVMTKQLAARGERKVRGKPYRSFYNPMWGHFGDRTTGPSGTYYLSSSKPQNYYWNIYDQVLLRPELMDTLRDVRILTSDGAEPLVTQNGTPKISDGSDHLPIFFQLEL